MGTSAPSRCRFASERPSVGSSGAGRLRLDSSKTSTSDCLSLSRVPWIRPESGCCGFLGGISGSVLQELKRHDSPLDNVGEKRHGCSRH